MYTGNGRAATIAFGLFIILIIIRGLTELSRKIKRDVKEWIDQTAADHSESGRKIPRWQVVGGEPRGECRRGVDCHLLGLGCPIRGVNLTLWTAADQRHGAVRQGRVIGAILLTNDRIHRDHTGRV